MGAESCCPTAGPVESTGASEGALGPVFVDVTRFSFFFHGICRRALGDCWLLDGAAGCSFVLSMFVFGLVLVFVLF